MITLIGILLIAGMLTYLMCRTLLKKKEEEKVAKIEKLLKYTGKWQSVKFSNENGDIEIQIVKYDNENDFSEADITITYSSTSNFKPNQKVELEMKSMYDIINKAYILKQIGTTTYGQFFVIHLPKKVTSKTVVDMVCVGPADLCEIRFEKPSKKDI